MTLADESELALNNAAKWVKWATEIQAISQTGLTYATGPYDRERYKHLQKLAAEMLAALSNSSFEDILSLFSKQAGYATPKVDVRGAVFKENKVLLVKERSDEKWTLPGGWADVNYSPAYCTEKEVWEESGYKVRVTKLVGLYDKLKHAHPPEWPHTYKCFFLCELLGGEAKPSIETSEVAFFSVDALPELSINRVTYAQIQRCYQHWLAPEIPSDYD